MNAEDLKQYVIDNNCYCAILEQLGCHDIHEYPKEFRAALPNGTNKTAVCVKKDTSFSIIRNSEGSQHGDIFSLVMNIKGCGFGEANKIIHQALGLKYSFERINKKEEKVDDDLEIYRKIKRKRNKRRHKASYDCEEIDTETTLSGYMPLPYIGWIREGITASTCKKFNIGYSYNAKRITIPWRKFGSPDNQIMGVVGRTIINNYELLDIPKYVGIIPFKKGITLYGINENYDGIQKAGYVVVFEAEKSVLKRCSLFDCTGTAIGNCELTEEQIRILISLNVEIIICFDKGVDINTIRKNCDYFYGIRPVSYIYDKWNLIKGEKDSPADQINKVYTFMLKHRIVYDENERKQYLKWQKENLTKNSTKLKKS